MRLVKKFGAVVAMAAVCLTMVAPITASAACYHDYQVYDTHYITLKDSHSCFVGTITKPDGTVTPLYETCRIVTKEVYYSMECTKCEDVILNQRQYPDIVTHSHPLCPYN